MKKIYLISVLIIMILSFAVVNAEINEFAEAEKLVQDKIPCSELNNLQLESVGDYYMEKMHPGEAHEIMESMMGGEGSESLRQIHIGIAKSFYCGENNALSPGMMNYVLRGGSNGYGMMGNSYYGMMGSYYPYQEFYPFNIFIEFLLIILLIVLIIIVLRKNKSRGKNKKEVRERK